MKSTMNPQTPAKVSRPPGAFLGGGRAARVAGVLLVVAAGYGLWKYFTASSQPWLVRWRLERFLKKEAHTGDFKTDFAFPSKAEMSQAPPKAVVPKGPAKGAKTGKTFDNLCDEYYALKSSALLLESGIARSEIELKQVTAESEALAKEIAGGTAADAGEQAASLSKLRDRATALQKIIASRPELEAKEVVLVPIVADLWEFQRLWQAEKIAREAVSASAVAETRTKFTAEVRKQLGASGSYSEMYKLIGQEIWVARKLLGSANPEHQRVGVSLALSASHQAIEDAQNGWVAARICEGYVLPHLDLADDTSRRSSFHPDNLLIECAEIFRANSEYRNVARTYELSLKRATTTTQSDWAKSQIAMAYDKAGDPKHALQYIHRIGATNNYRMLFRSVSRLEKQLKGDLPLGLN